MMPSPSMNQAFFPSPLIPNLNFGGANNTSNANNRNPSNANNNNTSGNNNNNGNAN